MRNRLCTSITTLGAILLLASCEGGPGSLGGDESQPDMEVVSFTVVDSGAFYEAEIKADNAELAESSSSFGYRIYLSSSSSFTPDSAEHQIPTDRTFRFNEDNTAAVSMDFWDYAYEYMAVSDRFIPNGTYYAGILVDANEELEESDESNNFKIDPNSFGYENPEDSREDNDSFDTATQISDVTYEGGWRLKELYINEGDDDYYTFSVTDAPGTLKVIYDADFFPAGGEVTLYDSTRTSLGSATGTYANFEYSLTTAGTYYARVRPKPPASAPYEFVVVLAEPSISDDEQEDNDFVATASNIGTLELNTVAGYTDFVSLDDDFFVFSVPSNGYNLTVNVIFAHSDGDVDAFLLDSEEQIVRSALSTTDNETLAYENIPSGTYYLWVAGDLGGTSYDIEFRYEE